MNPSTSESNPKCSMEQEENDSGLSLYEMVLQLLECPVCYNYLSPPLGQCVQGHVICPSCYDRLDRCPVCRSAKAQASALLLESIHGVIPLPCKYETLGCKSLTKGKDLQRHERTCTFAPIRCPLRRLNCLWEGNKDDLVDHLRNLHPERIIFGDTQNFCCKNVLDSNQLFMMVLFYTNDTLFRAYWEFDNKLELMKFAVCQLDQSKSKDQQQFYYSICMLDIKTKEETLRMMAQCYISDDIEQDLLLNKQFVAIHYDMMRRYGSRTGDVKYKIEIFTKDKLNSKDSRAICLTYRDEVQLS